MILHCLATQSVWKRQAPCLRVILHKRRARYVRDFERPTYRPARRMHGRHAVLELGDVHQALSEIDLVPAQTDQFRYPEAPACNGRCGMVQFDSDVKIQPSAEKIKKGT
jgi:hypothetical protein